MAAGSTYSTIATTTVSGTSTTEVAFASISGSYTDLILVANIGSTTTPSYLGVRLNSDTGTNYSVTDLYGNGTSATSSRASNRAIADLSYNVPVTSALDTNYIAHFMNYSNSTTYKTIITRDNNAANGTAATVCLWRNTAAITNIKCYVHTAGGSNLYAFANGSTLTLYGIAAA